MSRWVLEVYTEMALVSEEGYWSPLVAYPEGTEMDVLLGRLRAVRDVKSYTEARKVTGLRPVAAKQMNSKKHVPSYSVCVSAVRLRNIETGDIIMGDIV